MITALIIVFLVKFQSTLPRRERQSLEIYLILLCNFNPHSHEGSDKDHHNDLQSVVDFNPHSHEGSDSHTIQSAIIVTYFNPHSHEGSDVHHIVPISTDYTFQSTLPRRERHIYHIGLTPCALFQSTLPRRERLPFLSKFPFLYDFNPHSHEGSDTGKVPIYCGNFISIHTPTKGATAILTNNFLIFCSISLINFILYLQIIQILFIFRYKFIFYFIF